VIGWVEVQKLMFASKQAKRCCFAIMRVLGVSPGILGTSRANCEADNSHEILHFW
jgi:hypothetical protein